MLTVCNYHYIRNDFQKPYPSIFGVTPIEFENQLNELGKTATFITPNDLFFSMDEILGSKKSYLLVTFDDGLKEQFELALPILKNKNIEALFFINSMNYIEKKVSMVHKIHLVRSEISPLKIRQELAKRIEEENYRLTTVDIKKAIAHYLYDDKESACIKYLLNFKLPKDQLNKLITVLFSKYFNEEQVINSLYMTNDQLQHLANNNLIGNHTHSHLALGLLPKMHIEEEIYKTFSFLQNFKKNTNLAISYPYGSVEACQFPVSEIAHKVGHAIGFSMERGNNDLTANKLMLKRFSSNDLPGGKNYIKDDN